MRIFISGPMKNDPDHEAKFKKIEDILNKLGISPFNPAWLKVDRAWRRDNLLPIDEAAIEQCDAVIFMENWETAYGCMKEMQYALDREKVIFIIKGKKVIYHIFNSLDVDNIQTARIKKLASDIAEEL